MGAAKAQGEYTAYADCPVILSQSSCSLPGWPYAHHRLLTLTLTLHHHQKYSMGERTVAVPFAQISTERQEAPSQLDLQMTLRTTRSPAIE